MTAPKDVDDQTKYGERIAALEARVAELEERVAELEGEDDGNDK